MKKNTKNKYEFFYSENTKVWIASNITINNRPVTIEIFETDFNDAKIDWQNFDDFLFFLNQNIEQLDSKCCKLLLSFYSIIGWAKPDILYDFRLSTIIYKGKFNNHFFENQTFNYSFLYQLFHPQYQECYDMYGNYFVDIDNLLITGCRRIQV